MKKFAILSFVIVSLLVMSFQTTNVAGNQSVSIVSPDVNQAPIVNSPVDIVYVEGDTGHSITWEISDDNPNYWITTRNGEILNALPWVTLNETVIVYVDGLVAGNYEFKIYACDDIHNITDVVLVKVLSSDIEFDTPISISSNIQFNTTAQAEGWAGNGTAINPYIIEKLYITASYSCIRISGTDVHFIIRNCTFVKSGTDSGIGVDIQNVSNGTIENCTFANLWIGCITWFVSNCTWKSNLFGNLADGIWLNEATNCTIADNSFMSGGISISGYGQSNWIHEISGNMIGDRPIGYFEGLTSMIIDADDYGQIIVANCVDVDIFNGDFSNVGSAIIIGHSNDSDISHCDVTGGRIGIYLERTDGATIDTCHIYGASEIGMYINETSSTEVFNCSIQNIGFVGAQIGMCSDTTITFTFIEGCGEEGIVCYEGPSLFIANCTIQGNRNGIIMGGCTDSLIIGNTIQYNVEYGLNIAWASDGSRIFGNEFLNNGVENAYDDGTGTFWDDGSANGNTWSDYGGSGFYYILGSRNGIDHYPSGGTITNTVEVYDTADISYTVGTTGHYIAWETNCTLPSMYTIFLDGVVVRQQAWDGSSLVHNIDGLAMGEYNYTLEILGGFGVTASDSVIVTVAPEGPIIITTSPTNTTVTTTTNTTFPIGLQEVSLMISIGSAGVIVVVVILIFRTKKSPM